ncbi:hypothetical protein C1H46_032761 [Malus baccata]|uniref:Pentatricopeptide repeat-containing protein n=1 Tax=Malus baccata TaxID=106549 RepID=A0A540L5E4_MALBA|nr:hypothetical protein C1H46_032761 [Malus baccata]
MYLQGLAGNPVTFIFIFKACARASDIGNGKRVHGHAFKLGLETYLFVSNALIHMCAYCGGLGFGQKLFDGMWERDLVSWNSLICGYSQCNRFNEVLGLFEAMQAANVRADAVTMVKVILAYMYCKCGVVEKAMEVFQWMEKKDSVSWTSVISGLAVNGFADSALESFSRMLREGVQPTHGTFVGILLACAHVGLVEKGLEYFESMEKIHGLMPELKHYGCVVDLLSRSGKLYKASEFVQTMPVGPGACSMEDIAECMQDSRECGPS